MSEPVSTPEGSSAPADDYELVARLSAALRAAHRSGDLERARNVRAALSQAVHEIGLDLDPGGEVSPPIVRQNGYLEPEWLAQLGVDWPPQRPNGAPSRHRFVVECAKSVRSGLRELEDGLEGYDALPAPVVHDMLEHLTAALGSAAPSVLIDMADQLEGSIDRFDVFDEGDPKANAANAAASLRAVARVLANTSQDLEAAQTAIEHQSFRPGRSAP